MKWFYYAVNFIVSNCHFECIVILAYFRECSYGGGPVVPVTHSSLPVLLAFFKQTAYNRCGGHMTFWWVPYFAMMHPPPLLLWKLLATSLQKPIIFNPYVTARFHEVAREQGKRLNKLFDLEKFSVCSLFTHWMKLSTATLLSSKDKNFVIKWNVEI